MTEYICRLGTPSGEIVTKIVEAAAPAEARKRLESDGFRVFAISSAEEGLSSVLPFGGSKKGKVKQADFLLFNQQLSALLRAGIPVLQSIELLKTRSGSANLRFVLADVEEKIKNGIPLSEALEAQGLSRGSTPPRSLRARRVEHSMTFWPALWNTSNEAWPFHASSAAPSLILPF